jgi:hypothetical protein
MQARFSFPILTDRRSISGLRVLRQVDVGRLQEPVRRSFLEGRFQHFDHAVWQDHA